MQHQAAAARSVKVALGTPPQERPQAGQKDSEGREEAQGGSCPAALGMARAVEPRGPGHGLSLAPVRGRAGRECERPEVQEWDFKLILMLGRVGA